MARIITVLFIALLPSGVLADDRVAEVEVDAEEAAALEEPPPPDRAIVRHVPPAEAVPSTELRLLAVIDDAWVEGEVLARYRRLGSIADYQEVPFQRSSAGGYFALIPANAIGRPGIEYYIVGSSAKSKPHFASEEFPHVVRVETPVGDLWKEAELRRLKGRRYQLSVSMSALDFGTSFGTDRLVRGDVDWSYKLIHTLYSISLGYGFVEGITPSEGSKDASKVTRNARFGYGGMRFRLRESMWLDTKAFLGFGEEGFIVGVGGAVTFGDDWRTSVTIGGEALEELSYHGWIKLQWDTVAPFLMSATAGTTDQPGSQIDVGSYIKYEITFPVTSAFDLTANASFAARGNRPGGFGGGLASTLRF